MRIREKARHWDLSGIFFDYGTLLNRNLGKTIIKALEEMNQSLKFLLV
jgi:hypothetical protein